MIAKNLMSIFIQPLRKSDKISKAMKLMDENKVTHLPVIDEKNYIGLISESELMATADDSGIIEPLCKALPRPFINDYEHFFNALKIMTEQRISVLPVLDEKKYYAGLITAPMLLTELAQTMSVNNPGGIIILEVNQNDYSMSEIARIAEANDAKILNAAVKSIPDSTRMEVTLKLNRMNLEPVMQTFVRYGYDISFYFGDNEKNETMLRERYDLLMRYLET
ncbi:MAG: CBS domain-containing protein [Bacteroidales bacterium]|nr:CBS domain-containing protein [Bacteroidales bacterium]